MAKEISRINFSAIDSTNSWAKANIHLLDIDKITLVSADTQNAGRGRLTRQWFSPPKQNVLASFCFFVSKEQKNLFNIAQIMSLSAAKTLEGLAFHPKLKWPNDILLSNKKVGGILCETVSVEEKICVIVGIGMNINMPKSVIDGIDQPATSLLVEGGVEHDLAIVANGLSDHFVKDLDIFLKKGFSPFLVDYSARLVHVPNQSLKFHENDAVCEGTFHSLNEDGSLNLLLHSGEIKRCYAGEIT